MEDGRRIGVVAAKPVELLVEANDSEASLSSRCHAGGYMRPRLENGESRLVEVRRVVQALRVGTAYPRHCGGFGRAGRRTAGPAARDTLMSAHGSLDACTHS